MKRFAQIFTVLAVITLAASGCAGAGNDSGNLDQFTGEWNCEETLLEDPDTYVGYYALDVEANGEFSIYDAEAGNPGISGKMTVDSDTELTLTCDTEDFDPPAGWGNMSETQTIGYEFVDEDELHLIYSDDAGTSTLVFHLEETE